MHNEPEAVREILALSLNAKHHLSHEIRNRLMNIVSCASIGKKGIMDEIASFECWIRELGL